MVNMFGTLTVRPDVSEVAKRELGEDDQRRLESLEEMREWLRGTQYIKNCRQDANFLLRFLRHKKFNVPLAKETLVQYLTMRQENSKWFHNLSLYDPVVEELINRGVVFALPQRDTNGRRVIFTIGGNIDPNRHKTEDVMRAIMVCLESLLEDEENQVLGFSYILDESGITLSHISKLWRISDLKLWSVTEKGLPIRHRSMEFFRLPLVARTVVHLAKSVMSHKLQERIVVYKEGQEFKNVDVDILPKEYGGVTPMADMIASFKKEIGDRQDSLLQLDRMSIDVQQMSRNGVKRDK